MRRALPFALALALAACGISTEDLARIVAESRPCVVGDACSLAGGSQCTCATAVNAKDKQKVDDAAADVRCGGAMVDCAYCQNPQCIAGKCTCSAAP